MANELTKQDVERLELSIQRVEKKLGELSLDIQKLESYIYDDADTNTPGIVQRVRDHEKRIERIEEDERFKKRTMALIGTTGGAFGMAIIEFVKWIISNK
jgi:archaellum component FlaC